MKDRRPPVPLPIVLHQSPSLSRIFQNLRTILLDQPVATEPRLLPPESVSSSTSRKDRHRASRVSLRGTTLGSVPEPNATVEAWQDMVDGFQAQVTVGGVKASIYYLLHANCAACVNDWFSIMSLELGEQQPRPTEELEVQKVCIPENRIRTCVSPPGTLPVPRRSGVKDQPRSIPELSWIVPASCNVEDSLEFLESHEMLEFEELHGEKFSPAAIPAHVLAYIEHQQGFAEKELECPPPAVTIQTTSTFHHKQVKTKLKRLYTA
ncbi:hypothetical protein R1flu_013320 [Riccia fluitans]|uniref:Uncharacterized protein n=1 Tax=Riccia fluitans TaxID=41844 RepID=A0ABD1YE27_9MARC